LSETDSNNADSAGSTPAPPEIDDARRATPAVARLPDNQRITPTTWGWLAALIGWTLILAFYQLDGRTGLEPVEAWVAQPAREMYENISNMLANRETEGWDWRAFVIPRFCGEIRMQKSPGAYWTVCLVSYLRGGVVDETSARIPNAVASVLTVLTVFWLTRRIAGERSAIFAGFAAASSAMFLHWSHNAASDMGAAALITMSLACLWAASADEPPGWKRNLLWLAGYFFAGLGMLYKMPLPLACIGLPALLYVLLRNRWKIFASWTHVLGLLLFLLPWLPWALAAMRFEDAALFKWRVEYFDRVTGDLPNVNGQEQLLWYFFYPLAALLLTMPFSLSVPAALARPFRRAQKVNRDGVWFVFIWFIGLLVFLSISTGKETRYILPAMPPLFVLLGGELAAFFDPRRRANRGRDRLGLVGICVLTPAALVGLYYLLRFFWQEHASQAMFTWPEIWRPYVVAAAIFAIGVITSASLYYRRRENFAFASLVGMMWLSWLWVWPQLMPLLASQQPFKDFAAQLKALAPEHQVAIKQIAQQDPRYIWYADVRFPRVIDQLELLKEQDGRRDLAYETRRYMEETVRLLESDELCLLVANSNHYGRFMTDLRDRWEDDGNAFPETYVWRQPLSGRPDRRYILFGNRPPPWDEPPVATGEKWRAKLDARAPNKTDRPASAPAAAPTSEE